MQLLSTNICVLLVAIFIQQATIDDGPSSLMTNGLLSLVSFCSGLREIMSTSVRSGVMEPRSNAQTVCDFSLLLGFTMAANQFRQMNPRAGSTPMSCEEDARFLGQVLKLSFAFIRLESVVHLVLCTIGFVRNQHF
ncbi:hypothetical protein VB005_01470 [Metarhizium brunneum]